MQAFRAALHRRRGWIALLLVAGLFATLRVLPISAQGTTVISVRVAGALPTGFLDSRWSAASPLTLPLTAQAVFVPNGGGSVTQLTVRSMNNGSWIGFLVEWADATKDVAGYRAQDFPDAVAVQIAASPAVPFVCMGQVDSQVQIWQWRGDRDLFAGADPTQAGTYPYALANDYPFADDPTFYPAWWSGNPMVLHNTTPVVSLVAGGAGTIAPASANTVYGRGVFDGAAWHVVFLRPLAARIPDEVSMRADGHYSVAFAAWDGAAEERDGLKSTSNWITLAIGGSPSGSPWGSFVVPVSVVAAFLVLLFAAFRRRRRGPREMPGEPTRERMEER